MSFVQRAGVRVMAAFALGGALVLACSSDPVATKPKTECVPGNAYYCRCANRDEGSRVCNDDGNSYGPCEPCFADEPLPEEDSSVPQDDGSFPELDASDGGLCPNGKIDDGEECDDGNRAANDGCSAACKLEGSSATADKCSGMVVNVWDKPVVYTSTTAPPFANDYRVTTGCNGATGGLAEDRVFAVTAHKAGMLTVATSAAGFDVMLYATDKCTSTGASTPFTVTAATCVNAQTGNGPETLTVPVTAGQTQYVFVDGAANAQRGAFTITFSVP